jgi:hypothetical protein
VVLVLILRAVENNEADSFKRLYFSLVFSLLSREKACLQTDLFKVFCKQIALLIMRNDPIDDLAPVAQCGLIAREEIILVKGL